MDVLQFGYYGWKLDRIRRQCQGDANTLAATGQAVQTTATNVTEIPGVLDRIRSQQRDEGLRQGSGGSALRQRISDQIASTQAQIIPMVNAGTALEGARLAVEEAFNDHATIREWWEFNRIYVENQFADDPWRWWNYGTHLGNANLVNQIALREADHVRWEYNRQMDAAAELFHETERIVSAAELRDSTSHDDHEARLTREDLNKGPTHDQDEDITSMPAEPRREKIGDNNWIADQDRIQRRYPFLWNEDGTQTAYPAQPEGEYSVVQEDGDQWQVVEVKEDTVVLQHPFSVTRGAGEGVSSRRVGAYVAEVEVSKVGLPGPDGTVPSSAVYHDAASANRSDWGRELRGDGYNGGFPVPDTAIDNQRGVLPTMTVRELSHDSQDFGTEELQNQVLGKEGHTGGVVGARYTLEDGAPAAEYTFGVKVHDSIPPTSESDTTTVNGGLRFGAPVTPDGVGFEGNVGGSHNESEYSNIAGTPRNDIYVDLPPVKQDDVDRALGDWARIEAETGQR